MTQSKDLKEVAALSVILSELKKLELPQQNWVISSVVSNLQLSVNILAGGVGNAVNPTNQNSFSGASNLNIPDEAGSRGHAKAFLASKKPDSDVQRVACLAYYLSKFRDKSLFKTKDISEMNTYAHGIKIGNPARAVDNATKQNKYFAPAGKGMKQLTSLGEDVVEALPDKQAVLRVIQEHQPKRRAKRKRASKGKS